MGVYRVGFYSRERDYRPGGKDTCSVIMHLSVKYPSIREYHENVRWGGGEGFIDVEECRIKSVNRGLFKGFGSGAGGRGGGGQGTGEREIERLREYVEEGENMEFICEWRVAEKGEQEWGVV